MAFWNKKKLAPNQAPHEKYPEILEWEVGDVLRHAYEQLYRFQLLEFNEDFTLLVEVTDLYPAGLQRDKECRIIALEETQFNNSDYVTSLRRNASWEKRKMEKKESSANPYNEFLQFVKQEYQKLRDQ